MDARVGGARKVLISQRQAARDRIAAIAGEQDEVSVAASGSNHDDEHDPEGSTVAFERAQLASALTRARRHLDAVDEALRRLDAGQYGRCLRCGAPIDAERLRALPVTSWCRTCAARRDR